MSIYEKILTGLFLVVCLVLVGASFYIHHLQLSQASLQTNVSLLQGSLDSANKTIEVQRKVAAVSDKVTTDTAKMLSENEVTKEQLTKKVNDVAEQVANEKITDGVADTLYIGSMWTAYCKASPSDGICTTGRPISPMPH